MADEELQVDDHQEMDEDTLKNKYLPCQKNWTMGRSSQAKKTNSDE